MSIDNVERSDSSTAAIHPLRHKSPSYDKTTVVTISLTVLTVIALTLFAIFMTCQLVYGIPVCGLNCALSCAVFGSLTIACLSFIALLTTKVWTLIKLKISYKPERSSPKPITDPQRSTTPRIVNLSDPIQQPPDDQNSDTPPPPSLEGSYPYEEVPIVNSDEDEPFDSEANQNITPLPAISPILSSPKKASDEESSEKGSPARSKPITEVRVERESDSDREESSERGSPVTSKPITEVRVERESDSDREESSEKGSPVTSKSKIEIISPPAPPPSNPIDALRAQVVAVLPTIVLPEDVVHPEVLRAILRNPGHIEQHLSNTPFPQHPFNPAGLAEIMGCFTENAAHLDPLERCFQYGASQILFSESPLGTVGSPSPSSNQTVLGVQANRWGAKSTSPGLCNLIHDSCWSKTTPEPGPRGPQPFSPGDCKYTKWQGTLVTKRWLSTPCLVDATSKREPSWDVFAQMYPPVRGNTTGIKDPETCLSMLSKFYKQIFQKASSDLTDIHGAGPKNGRVLQIPLFGKESTQIPDPLCNSWCYVNLMCLFMGLKDFEDARQKEEEIGKQQAGGPVDRDTKPLTVLVNGISHNHLLNQLHPPFHQRRSSSAEEEE